jgi:hypothetical protein
MSIVDVKYRFVKKKFRLCNLTLKDNIEPNRLSANTLLVNFIKDLVNVITSDISSLGS